MENCRYADMLSLPHPVSQTHQPMPRSARAAQFAPFAALTGYEEAVKETARLTDVRKEPDDPVLSALDRKMRYLCGHLSEKPEIRILYFQPDGKKAGGAYHSASGIVRRVEETERRIRLEDGTAIPMDAVLSLEGECFDSLEGEWERF